MLHLVILLLSSGSAEVLDNGYHLINTPKNWTDAQSFCSDNYDDLATIGNHGDMKRLDSALASLGVTSQVWIGLSRIGPASWLWSVGETQISPGLVEYTNWASFLVSTENCGGMRDDGKWFTAPCSTTLPFICQKDLVSSAWFAVFEAMTWKQAQEYCRLKNTDLASARSATENLALRQIIHDNAPLLSTVWIGLFRDDWKWSDQSSSSFRNWVISQPNDDGKCALYYPHSKGWYDRDCAALGSFLCYKEPPRQNVKIVRVEVKSDPTLDFSDFAVSQAILNQIQTKGDWVKVQWRVQPDGNIFRNKYKKTLT